MTSDRSWVSLKIWWVKEARLKILYDSIHIKFKKFWITLWGLNYSCSSENRWEWERAGQRNYDKDEKMFKGEGCIHPWLHYSWVYTYLKDYQVVHFSYVQLIFYIYHDLISISKSIYINITHCNCHNILVHESFYSFLSTFLLICTYIFPDFCYHNQWWYTYIYKLNLLHDCIFICMNNSSIEASHLCYI